MSYVYAFLGFAALIVLHEAGHFAAAKAVGMRVERFSLFFGPMWLKRRRGETEYGVGVIPLGGYVKITGMSAAEVYETPEIEARAYMNQPVWKRIVVILAGPGVNLLLAFALLWVFYTGQAHPVLNKAGQVVATKEVAAVYAHTPAAAVLRGGETIVSIGGVTSGPEAMHRAVMKHTCAGGAKINNCRATTPIRVVIRDHGKLRSFSVYPRYSKADKGMWIGFAFLDKWQQDDVGYAAGASISGLWNATTTTLSTLAHIFNAKERSQLHTVVTVYGVTASFFRASVSRGFEVLAYFSLALAIFNLLPFLPLDGGHVFWALVEKVRRRRVSFIVMERASMVGIGLVLVLFAVGLSNDISSHFSLATH